MKKILNISVPTLISCGAAVLSLLTLICAAVAGQSLGNFPKIIILFSILGALCELVPLVFNSGAVALTAGSVLTLTGFMVLTCTHLNKIGLILNGVVTEKIPFAFYACAVFALLSSVACIVAGFMGTDKKAE